MLGGKRDLASTIDQVKAGTRQFARRQETWFRGLSECRFLAMDDDESPESLADRIVASADH